MLANIEDINNNFNKEQIEAVESINGYVFNSAPPGSGKTFVLENRILWMAVEHQIPTKNILAITFTNEAANEMKTRISERLKEFDIENNVTATTFHSFAYKIIKNFGKGSVARYFTLIDDTDKNKIISQMIKDKNLDEGNKELNRNLIKQYSDLISAFKSKGLTPKMLFDILKEQKERIDKYSEDKELLEKEGLNKLDLQDMIEMQNLKVMEYEVYRTYEQYKLNFSKENKGVLYDFDDLMINLKILLSRVDIRKEISKLYTYVLCDESQDIDEVQRDILLLLSRDNGNLFCIFDDDQSIYSFRNADQDLILGLPKLVSNPKEIILKENFRSTKNIIEAANHVINNNKYRIYKWMTTNNQDGELPVYKALPSKEKEADFICDKIEELMKEYKFDYSDFAILYRNNDLNRTIEQRLIKRGIPYKINRNISFFQKKEIKDIIAYLEVCINKSIFHLDRIYKVPTRGIGDKTYLDLKEKAINCGMNIFEILSAETKSKIKEFNDLLEELMSISDKSFNEIINFILEKTDYLNSEYTESERAQRESNINNLRNLLSEAEELFETKQECLVQLKIISGEDEESGKDNKVSLMTIHSSKGKGFKVVFMIGCEDGVLPSFGALSDMDIEEERRLFYVGMTRAKLFLFMTRSQYRLDYNGNLKPTVISPFIEEIPDNLLVYDEGMIF